MSRHSRWLLPVLLLAAIAGLFWRATSQMTPPPSSARSAAPPTLERGGTLTATVRSEPRSFNRAVSRDLTTAVVSTLTQAPLVRVDRATQAVEPWLAESWEESADGRTFTLRLRDGLRWSDGQPFTAEDVLFSVDTIFDPRSASVLASSLHINGKPFTARAPDPRTVVITYPSPFGPGIRLLDNLTVLPRHKLAAAAAAGTFTKAWGLATPPDELVGTGPFRLAQYDPGERLIFERNPHYWRRDDRGEALPYLDRLVLRVAGDQNAELLQLQSGEADMVQQAVRAEDIAAIRPLIDQGRLDLIEVGVSTDPDAFFINLRPGYWANNPRAPWITADDFRRALSHAVDREAFAETVFLAAAVPIHGPITPGNREWFWPGIPRYEFSRDKATALLTGLGLSNHDEDPWLEDADGDEARLRVLIYAGNTVLERGAAVLRDDLQQVGVALDVVPLEPGTLNKRLESGDFEAIFFNYTNTNLDPAMQLDFWQSSGSAHLWNMEQPTPATKWEQQIDELMTAQATTIDPAKRRALFNDVQRLMAEHLPILNFAAPRLYMGVSSRLVNLTPAPLRPQLLWSADTIAIRGKASTAEEPSSDE